MEAAQTGIASICMNVQVELVDVVRGFGPTGTLEQLDVVIRHWIPALVQYAHHELLPLVDFFARTLCSIGRILDPFSEPRSARNL